MLEIRDRKFWILDSRFDTPTYQNTRNYYFNHFFIP